VPHTPTTSFDPWRTNAAAKLLQWHTATTTDTATKPTATSATAIISESTAMSTAELNTTATKTTTTNQKQNKIQQADPAIQTGLDRYIQVKRKLSPQNSAVGNKSKINRVQIYNKLPGTSNSNRFVLPAENEPEQDQDQFKLERKSRVPWSTKLLR